MRGEDIEFMHYFHGEQNQGGLRVLPGSQGGAWNSWQEGVEAQRELCGSPTAEQLAAPFLTGVADAELPGEAALELDGHQLIIRSSRLLHATYRRQHC